MGAQAMRRSQCCVQSLTTDIRGMIDSADSIRGDLYLDFEVPGHELSRIGLDALISRARRALSLWLTATKSTRLCRKSSTKSAKRSKLCESVSKLHVLKRGIRASNLHTPATASISSPCQRTGNRHLHRLGCQRIEVGTQLSQRDEDRHRRRPVLA